MALLLVCRVEEQYGAFVATYIGAPMLHIWGYYI